MTAYNSVKGLNGALRSLPKEATDELRTASGEIAQFVVEDAQAGAMHVGGVARLVAPSIKVGRDRVPAVKMGGSTRLPVTSTRRSRKGSRQTVGDIWAGSEFGGGARATTHQFKPHRGKVGYFLWPAVRQDSDRIQRTYSEALDDALQRI